MIIDRTSLQWIWYKNEWDVTQVAWSMDLYVYINIYIYIHKLWETSFIMIWGLPQNSMGSFPNSFDHKNDEHGSAKKSYNQRNLLSNSKGNLQQKWPVIVQCFPLPEDSLCLAKLSFTFPGRDAWSIALRGPVTVIGLFKTFVRLLSNHCWM